VPRVYFIRQVREDAKGRGYIDVVNEPIPIRKSYINYFVLAEWTLVDEKLNVLFEKDKQTKTIQSIDFKINPNSKYRLN